jgi:hypothetical protein
MNDRVDYFCARPEHQAPQPNDALTMHKDRWAYCGGGAAEPHDWKPTGGMSLDYLKQLIRHHPIRPLGTADQRSD